MKRFFSVFFVICFSAHFFGQNFKIIPLGVRGGTDESNLSAYLIAESAEENYLCLDAGTLYSGIKFYLNQIPAEPADFLRNKIKGYFISHPHFDHTSGLIINSPEDAPKNIYASQYTINVLKNHVFTWETWANFTNDGEKPTLGKYKYSELNSTEFTPVSGTSLSIKLFNLSHGGAGKSSAVLVKNSKNAYFLYLGDTGADRIEKSDLLENLWKAITPLIKENRLKGIALECSYSDEQPDNLLFGHLKPSLLIEEMGKLEENSGKNSLKNTKLIITHIKPKSGIEDKIKAQLSPLNTLIKIEFAVQGKVIDL